MLRRTHLAVGLGIAMHFVTHVPDQFLFIFMVMLATVLPDVDSGFSALGKSWFTKPVHLFVSHRGILHSYTFCVAVSVALTFIYSPLALPFFLGYSMHLFADSFTVQGIKPFWPLNYESKGPVKTGGVVEDTVFWTIVVIDVFIIAGLFI
jgi:inner membrane protein